MTGNLFPARLREAHRDKHQNTNFRRNGKLQACEPCRKGKLRCDHMMPTCGRCFKRGKPDQCLYHPAPLTKAPSPHGTHSEKSSPRLNSFSVTYQASCSSDRSIAAADGIHVAKRARTSDPSQAPSLLGAVSQRAEPPTRTIYEGLGKPLPDGCVRPDAFEYDSKAGLISHSAVLAEHELNIGITTQPSGGGAIPAAKVPQRCIEQGAAVLTLFQDFSAMQKYIEKWFSFAGGVVVIEPMVKIYLDGLWSTWHKTLESQKPTDMRLMAEKIWENTLAPVSRLLDRHTTPREFCSNVTGAFLRWEVVGILVTLVSLVAQSLKDGDPVFCSQDDAPVDRAMLALKTYNASELCVQFCDDFGVLNDLYLWLVYENAIAYCAMRPKGSYENSRKNASLANALLSCNLHQEIKVNERTPFFMAELRKRLFICAYESDKYNAAFSGRPPRLTRQYCRLQLPLDLTDTQTMSDGLELSEAVNDLDEQGWNQSGTIHRSTFARLFATNALITEEILELSLGDFSQSDISQRAAEIERRTYKFWKDLPDFLRIDDYDIESSRRSPLESLFLVIIRLNHLDHRFMLQRTMSKKVYSGLNVVNIKLLSVCSEIFSLIVKLVDNKDYFRDFQIDFVQILVKHGIPTAAVLAAELLQQERHTTSASATAYPLHRSDTIQSLSVLVSCLGSIKPDASGYQSCMRGRDFLKRILDTILGAGPASASSPQTQESTYDPMFGAPLLQPSNDGDFAKWLDGVEWDQDSWINFN